MSLYYPNFELLDNGARIYERTHKGEWLACSITVQTVGVQSSDILEQQYQEMKNYKPKKQNQFIACVLADNATDEIIIECNRIESNGNQTLIFGIMEDSTHGYDILLATMPSSEKVFLKMNK